MAGIRSGLIHSFYPLFSSLQLFSVHCIYSQSVIFYLEFSWINYFLLWNSVKICLFTLSSIPYDYRSRTTRSWHYIWKQSQTNHFSDSWDNPRWRSWGGFVFSLSGCWQKNSVSHFKIKFQYLHILLESYLVWFLLCVLYIGLLVICLSF